MKNVLLSWSSGKDSAWVLHRLRNDPDVGLAGLLTTVNASHDRVAMHATRRTVLEAQARAVGLDLHVVPIPWPSNNEAYEAAMDVELRRALGRGVTHVAFGDIHLDDVREYRIKQLERWGLEPLFPIWHEPTLDLARQMIENGLQAVVTCIDPRSLPRRFVGRPFDESFLSDLPGGVDPCGENGEFHTCVTDGPGFGEALPVRTGEIVERDGFVFADVLLT